MTVPKLELTIRFEHDALVGEGRNQELRRILANVRDWIGCLADDEGGYRLLTDINGNRCGAVNIPHHEEESF